MYKEGINQAMTANRTPRGLDTAYEGPVPDSSYITIEARLRKINDSNRFNIDRLENIIGRLTSYPDNNADLSGMAKSRMLDSLTDVADCHANRINNLINILEDLV